MQEHRFLDSAPPLQSPPQSPCVPPPIALREKLFYKPGHSLNKRGARKKTSVNVYMYAEAVYTLKEPEALALERAMGSVV